MASQKKSTADIINLTANIITPLMAIERTMVMPFNKKRHENDGEHSFSLGLLACAIASTMDPTLDTGKLAQYALVHEIVELHTGDISVWESDEVQNRKDRDEFLSAKKIEKDFPNYPWVASTYLDYDKRDTPEKCFIYALDKIYPHLLILIGNHHPIHPTWEAYERTEKIAREKISCYPLLLPLFDELCTMFRQHPEFFATAIPKNEQK